MKILRLERELSKHGKLYPTSLAQEDDDDEF